MVGKSKEDPMATIKELYDLCKKKQKAGEKLGFLLKAFVEEYEKEDKEQTTKEVSVTFIKKKENK
jgi:hypothetical protein